MKLNHFVSSGYSGRDGSPSHPRSFRRKRPATWIILCASIACAVSCAKKIETGPSEIRWDRASCERCSMAISDRNYSAQIRGGATEAERGLYLFDDIGCAVIWLDDQAWKGDAMTEVWVNHHDDGSWLNAYAAWFVKEKQTPMDYGLGAQSREVDGAIGFEAAQEHIRNRR